MVPAIPAAPLATAPQAVARTGPEAGGPGADASPAGLSPRVTLTFTDDMTEKYAEVAVPGTAGAAAAGDLAARRRRAGHGD